MTKIPDQNKLEEEKFITVSEVQSMVGYIALYIYISIAIALGLK